MKKILVLCTGNSCRSQMAEAYLRQCAGEAAEIYSAGLEAHGLNPRAMKVLQEDGIDTSRHESQTLDTYLNTHFDIVLTVCDHAQEHCPVFPGIAKKMHVSFTDPAKFTGPEEEVLNRFRAVRDQIKQYCCDFCETQL